MIEANLTALLHHEYPHEAESDATPALDPDPAPGFKADGTRYTEEEITTIWANLEAAAARLPELEAKALG